MTNFSVAPQPARAAPDADQDVERDQHRLPEDVEEQQVLGDEDADDRAGQQQHQPVVGARPLAAGPERVADRRRDHDDGQADEPEREAVEADVVRDVQVAEPGLLLLELEARLVEVEARDGVDPERDLDERDEQRDRRRPRTAAAAAPHEQRAGDGQEDQRGRHQRTATKTTVEDGDAGGDRERVGAHEAGLEAAGVAPEPAPTPCTSSRTEPKISGRSIQRPRPRGQEDGRPVEREVVRLVEVELVLEQVLRPGDPRRGRLARAVDRTRRCRSRPRRARRRGSTRPPPASRSPRRAAARPGRASSRPASRRRRTGASRRSPPARRARRRSRSSRAAPRRRACCVRSGARARTRDGSPQKTMNSIRNV